VRCLGVKGQPLIIIPDKLQLYAFVFDETFRTLQAQGSPISLAEWYGQADVSILHMSPVCGDEVVLVDSTMQARIFSFVTMQFRWVSFSSDETGSCINRGRLVPDPPHYGSNLSQALYTHLRMGLVSLFCMITLRNHL
jgi:hypothetical protein